MPMRRWLLGATVGLALAAGSARAQFERWETLSSMPTARDGACAAAISQKIYVAGGRGADRTKPLDLVEVYDIDNDRWDTIEPLNTPRVNAAAVTYNGRLYIIGGYDGTQYLSSVEIYDPDRESWTDGTAMPTPRAGEGVVAFLGKLFVIGGRNSTGFLNTMDIYDPREDTWTDGPPMNDLGRDSFLCGANRGMLFVVGGYYGQNRTKSGAYTDGQRLASVKRYIVSKSEWDDGPSLPQDRSAAVGGVIKNTFWVTGGLGDDDPPYESSTWILDTATNLWTAGPLIDTPCAGAAYTIVNFKLYTFGGFANGAPIDAAEVLTQ